MKLKEFKNGSSVLDVYYSLKVVVQTKNIQNLVILLMGTQQKTRTFLLIAIF